MIRSIKDTSMHTSSNNSKEKIITSSPSHVVMLFLSIALLGILTIVVTYYFVQSMPLSTSTQLPNQQIPEKITINNDKKTNASAISVHESPTQTMKIYTNQQYGYSFSYPSDWNISTSFYPKTIYLAKGYTFPPDIKWGPYDLIIQEKDTNNMASMTISNIDDGVTSQKSLEDIAKSWRQGETTSLLVNGLKAIKVHQLPITGAGGGSLLGNPHTISVFLRSNKQETFLIQLETENLSLFEPVFTHLLTSFTFTQ